MLMLEMNKEYQVLFTDWLDLGEEGSFAVDKIEIRNKGVVAYTGYYYPVDNISTYALENGGEGIIAVGDVEYDGSGNRYINTTIYADVDPSELEAMIKYDDLENVKDIEWKNWWF